MAGKIQRWILHKQRERTSNDPEWDTRQPGDLESIAIAPLNRLGRSCNDLRWGVCEHIARSSSNSRNEGVVLVGRVVEGGKCGPDAARDRNSGLVVQDGREYCRSNSSAQETESTNQAQGETKIPLRDMKRSSHVAGQSDPCER